MVPLLVVALGCVPSEGPAAAPLSVLAASSLTDVLPGVAARWEADTGQSATFTFDASSRLARQVEAGLPADVVITADVEWMAWLAERALVRPETRRDLLGNALVLVVARDAPFAPRSAAELTDPRVTHLALGGENVPAGRYARAALETAGAWDGLEPRVVRGDHVRTVLGWVAGGEAEAGVVYATDARVEPRVAVAFTFPDAAHAPIVYPAAVAAASARPEAAVEFLAFCASPEGRAVFEAAGFRVLP